MYKLDEFTNLNLQRLSFNRTELEQFKAFIDQNRLNFPSSCFVEKTKKEEFDLIITNDLPQNSLPLYLIYQKRKTWIINLSSDEHCANGSKL
jgi:hypothetical protein